MDVSHFIAVAFAVFEQTLPQEPQLFTLEVTSVSHPAAAVQLPQPALHAMLQLPLEQDAVPLTLEQTMPQPLQLLGSVAPFVSQPAAAVQSRKGAVQPLTPQTPFTQDGVPFVALQMMPHPPQLLMSPVTFFSQPFAPLPSQLPQPGLHTG